GQPTCYYYNYVTTDVPNVAAEIVNYMGYDVQTFGNHDVETGHKVYDKWSREVSCPVVGANIIDRKTGRPYVKPYTVLQRDGIKIAVLGMLTPAIPNWLDEELWSGLAFEDMMETARLWVKYLREEEKADVIVGLFHSGWSGGISTPQYVEDETEAVAREVPGFDVIFFGHDHRRRIETVVNVAGDSVHCVNPSCNAVAVGDVSIRIEVDKNNKLINKKITGRIHDVCNEEVDNEFVEKFQPSIARVKDYVDRPIGVIEDSIHTRDCFFGSAPFADLIHNLQLAITGADVSFNAPLSVNVSVPKGEIRMSDMFKLYKYENMIYVMRMTGQEIRKHLEMSYDLWVNTMTSADDHILLLDDRSRIDMQKLGFKNLTFNFDSAAGIEYEVDVTRPNGSKVRILRFSDGRPFREGEWYRVVMNSYRGNGGGELLTKGAGIPRDSLKSRVIYQSEKDQRYYLAKEIENMGRICPKANGNWRFVPEAWTEPAIRRDKELMFGK
ncbi:MAG: 5'-nucleotidase C-terminal domain-containing protein, partial [Prevotella sp.]|nr:5'-nucleotidase C-terminal domain-containing protein [Prevotella sp.]